MKIAKMLVPCFGSLSITGFIDNALIDNGVICYNGHWVKMQKVPNNIDNQQIRQAYLGQNEEQGIRNGLSEKTLRAFNVGYMGDYDTNTSPWESYSVSNVNYVESEFDINAGSGNVSTPTLTESPSFNVSYVEVENYNSSTYTAGSPQTLSTGQTGNCNLNICGAGELPVLDFNFMGNDISVTEALEENKDARQRMNDCVNSIFPNGKNETELNERYVNFDFYHFSTNREVILMVQSPKMDNSITALFDENGWLIHIRKIAAEETVYADADYFYRRSNFSKHLFFLSDINMCKFQDKWTLSE